MHLRAIVLCALLPAVGAAQASTSSKKLPFWQTPSGKPMYAFIPQAKLPGLRAGNRVQCLQVWCCRSGTKRPQDPRSSDWVKVTPWVVLRDNPEFYPLHVDYCFSAWCSASLTITSPTLIMFPGRKASDMSAILADAIEYLRTH
jgi:hypothetical protein